MFHYVIKMNAKYLHVLDVLLRCQKYVLMYKIGAEATISPRPFMEVISDVCQVHADFEEIERVLWTWKHELDASGLAEGSAVASKENYDRFLSMLESEYGDLPAKHTKVPDLGMFQAFQKEALTVFKAAPLMDFEADASARKLLTPAAKLAN